MDGNPAPTPEVIQKAKGSLFKFKKIFLIPITIALLAGLIFYLWQSGRLNIPLLKRANQVNPKLLEKAKNEIPGFITQTLKSEFVPSTVNTRPTMGSDDSVFDPNRFNTSWNLPNGLSGFASVKYTNKSIVEDKNILIVLSSSNTELTADSASTLAKQYISLEAKAEWKCDKVILQDQNNVQATICESFWSEDNVKRGIGVMSPIPNQRKTSIFYCEIHPSSTLHNWKSCSIYKSESGWD